MTPTDRNRPRLVKAILLLVAGLPFLAGPASAAGDARLGKELAKKWCASCHIISPDQTTGSADVLSFMAIAKKPDFSEAGIIAFLTDPHPKMPNMNLTRNELEDLAAYIASLR